MTRPVPRKRDDPTLPVTVAEPAKGMHTVHDAGAALVRMHGRNGDEALSSDPERFAALRPGIRLHSPEMIVRFATGCRAPQRRSLSLLGLGEKRRG